MSKANILHVINGWALGGIAQATLELIKATPDYKHFAIGYCWLDTPVVKEFEEAGCTNIVTNENYDDFISILKQHKIDIIVKQTGGGDNPDWVMQAHNIGIPIIENLHCPRQSFIAPDICTFTVGQSQYTASKNKDRTVKVIPNICTLPLGEPKKFPEPNKTIVVGRLARYELDKLHHVIYNVARMLEEYRMRINFLLMGHEFNTQYYKTIKGLEKPPYFVVEGRQEDKLTALKRLDICVNPTWEAGFEYCLVEAMSQGIPVITWEDSAGPETAGDVGLVARKEIFHLAMKVYRMCCDPELYEKCSIAGLEKVRNLYSPKYVGDQYTELFESCLKGATSV